MTKEQLELFIKYKTVEFEYISNIEEFNIDRYLRRNHYDIEKQYNLLNKQIKEQNIILDKKYIPQFWESKGNIGDIRSFEIGDEVFVNIPEDAGEWCDSHIELFTKEGIVSKLIPDIEFGGHHIFVKFDDKEEYVDSRWINKL